jgi:hypothetical protein
MHRSAPKQDPVKSCYSTDDAVSVPCQKTLHDSPPLDSSAKDIMREEIMGRHCLFWLRPARAASCVSWFRVLAFMNGFLNELFKRDQGRKIGHRVAHS